MASSLKKKRKILLVDNDPRTSYIISLILKLNGYDVEYYPDPKAMLSQLHNSVYDLILLSLSSAKTNYLELYNQIRNKDAHVKICFMIDDSYHADYYYDNKFVQSFKEELKSCDFIDKPINTNELLEIVISHLEDQQK
ncbi:MAG TPA: response regulator [Nitrososphaeraceae archaeon]|jgi:DNA-binding response OmpR family regulator|nr:response regulator [Nitrososphaeraceae archaeon]